MEYNSGTIQLWRDYSLVENNSGALQLWQDYSPVDYNSGAIQLWRDYSPVEYNSGAIQLWRDWLPCSKHSGEIDSPTVKKTLARMTPRWWSTLTRLTSPGGIQLWRDWLPDSEQLQILKTKNHNVFVKLNLKNLNNIIWGLVFLSRHNNKNIFLFFSKMVNTRSYQGIGSIIFKGSESGKNTRIHPNSQPCFRGFLPVRTFIVYNGCLS